MISKFLRLSLILAQVHISVSDICRYPHEKFIGSRFVFYFTLGLKIHILYLFRCYAFVPKRHNFETAEIYCHGQGYSLATVDSAITSNFLACKLFRSDFDIEKLGWHIEHHGGRQFPSLATYYNS